MQRSIRPASSISRRGLLGAAVVLVAGCSASSKRTSTSNVATEPTPGPPASTAATTPPATAPAPTANVAGTRTHIIELQGLDREFIVYTPEAAVGVGEVPVVFMLHGTSGDGQTFFDISGWRELADEEGFVAVFPSSLTLCWLEDDDGDGDLTDAGETKVNTRWNAGQDRPTEPLCTDEQVAALPKAARAALDHPLPDDVEFVRRMLELLSSEYSVDRSRVYASGFSNGGQMAARLMVDLDEEFAAIAVAAGYLGLAPEPASHPMDLVFSVGANDRLFTAVLGVPSIPLDETLFDLPLLAKFRDDYLTVGQLANEYTMTETMSPLGKVLTFRFTNSLVGADNSFSFTVLGGLDHLYPRAMAAALWKVFEPAHL